VNGSPSHKNAEVAGAIGHLHDTITGMDIAEGEIDG